MYYIRSREGSRERSKEGRLSSREGRRVDSLERSKTSPVNFQMQKMNATMMAGR